MNAHFTEGMILGIINSKPHGVPLAAWVSSQLKELQNTIEMIREASQEEVEEKDRHQECMKILEQRRIEIQKKCPHHEVQAFPNDVQPAARCLICGGWLKRAAMEGEVVPWILS